MYLFNRRTRLVGGNGTAGIEWATATAAKVTELTGQEIQLWATVYSPGFGTISWTSWFNDLSALEKVGDTLNADASMRKLTDQSAKHTIGGLDDAIFQPIYGAPDPTRQIQYVSGVTAVAAPGAIERAMSIGVEIAQKVEAVTGKGCIFARALTGAYASVGWLTAYEDIAAFEAAGDAIAADASLMKLVDSSAGCYVEDPSITQQTIYRRIA
jgi:hypothetical protein